MTMMYEILRYCGKYVKKKAMMISRTERGTMSRLCNYSILIIRSKHPTYSLQGT